MDIRIYLTEDILELWEEFWNVGGCGDCAGLWIIIHQLGKEQKRKGYVC